MKKLVLPFGLGLLLPLLLFVGTFAFNHFAHNPTEMKMEHSLEILGYILAFSVSTMVLTFKFANKRDTLQVFILSYALFLGLMTVFFVHDLGEPTEGMFVVPWDIYLWYFMIRLVGLYYGIFSFIYCIKLFFKKPKDNKKFLYVSTLLTVLHIGLLVYLLMKPLAMFY